MFERKYENSGSSRSGYNSGPREMTDVTCSNAASRHKCPSSRMGPGRFIAANAIRSIDLLDHLVDHLVDTKPSIFLNDIFIGGQHPLITETFE